MLRIAAYDDRMRESIKSRQDSPWYVDFKKTAILSARLSPLNLHLQGATLLSFSGSDSCSLDLSTWTVSRQRGCGYP